MAEHESGPWVVYEANGGERGAGDLVYGPFSDREHADHVAAYINTFPQERGAGWVLPLRTPEEAP